MGGLQFFVGYGIFRCSSILVVLGSLQFDSLSYMGSGLYLKFDVVFVLATVGVVEFVLVYDFYVPLSTSEKPFYAEVHILETNYKLLLTVTIFFNAGSSLRN
jgi:hypothetical protein